MHKNTHSPINCRGCVNFLLMGFLVGKFFNLSEIPDFIGVFGGLLPAKNYKHCSFGISDKHLKLQRVKGLKNLNFKPFSLSVVFL